MPAWCQSCGDYVKVRYVFRGMPADGETWHRAACSRCGERVRRD